MSDQKYYLDQFFHHFSMELVPVFLGMQLRGVLVDQDRRAEMREEYIKERDEAVERLEAAAGMKVMSKKTLSSVAVMHLLYDVMGLPVQKHHKTRRPTADRKALDKLILKVNDNQRPLFSDIIAARDLGVEINTFLDSKLDDDGRLRWSTNAAGTKSGRISTSGSPFWTGTNIQNWNQKIRNIVVADDDYCFVYVDGEQAEARVVAFLAEDPDLIQLFESGINVHKAMANICFGTPIAQVSKAHPHYKLSKTVVHAANYRMSSRMAAMMLKMPEWEASQRLEAYHSRFPGVRSRFHTRIIDLVQRTRTLTTPFFRRRQFFERMSPDLLKGAISYVPQSTIADWLNCGLLRSVWFNQGQYNAYPDSIMGGMYALPELRYTPSASAMQFKDYYPTINIHDGLLSTCKVENLRACIDLMREALTFGIQFPTGILTIPVDVKIATRWGTEHPADEEWISKFESGYRD